MVALPSCFYSVGDVRPGLSSGGSDGDGGETVGAGAPATGPEPPLELATGQASPSDLTQDEQDLYFTAADGVHRCAKSGEPDWLRKVTDGSELGQLVVDDTWVYFADGAGSRIAKVEKVGGLAQTVVSVDGPFAVATDGSLLYYGAAVGVFSVSKDGSGVRQLHQTAAARPDAIKDIAVTEHDIVFGDSEARAIFACAKDGSAAPRELSKLTGEVTGVTILDDTAYLRERVSSSGLLAAVGLSTGERRDLLADEPGPAGIAAGLGRVFFANDSPDAAELRQYDLLSGRVTSIVSGLASVHALVADAAAVYWTEPSAGRVMKISLTP
jgi:hypothetical protein